ncbi:unnamed protein product [Pocillopora meandrina]|uniref:ATP synthase subunit gamma n=1 Tax=Pocillopora meandrina TaxID=46732 RepID=A0AAU9Y2A7_9CNID|nr:unnamed protein product [Pocillopora meandrina]
MAANTVFIRGAVFRPASCPAVRNMATLKDISLRLRSVKNIQKITKSMKMVSAAKFGKAERELRPARIYGAGASALYDKVEIKPSDVDKTTPKNLIVVMSSDRGLCGGIHSNLVKAVKAALGEKQVDDSTKIVACGEKARQLFLRTHGDYLLMSFSEIGKRPPQFCEATFIAQEILDSGFQYDMGEMYYNWFKSVVSYKTQTKPLHSFDTLNSVSGDTLSTYDDLDSDAIKNYSEFSLASLLFYGMKEGACSEQSSRMTAMDSASKNAGEMIDKLTLTYNRTRQAVITRELIEIISGAAALD